jgi:glutaredoxin
MSEGAGRTAGSVHLVLYSRAYCHLCDDMLAAVAALQPEHGFTLEVVDVDADPALEARYDVLVPVLATAGGDEVCHHVLDRQKLLAILAIDEKIC